MPLPPTPPCARQLPRAIWGTVVPFGQVWKLGADVATHFTTTRDLRIGDADVAAGTYTLWMIVSGENAAKLIISKETKIFGTQYNPTHDLVRIPLVRRSGSQTERLTLSVADGALTIQWGDAAWSVPVSVR